MKIVDNLTASASAIAMVRAELQTRRLGAGEVIALHYMLSFTEADGRSVAGFVPGYAIDYVRDRDFGDWWVLARISEGLEVSFMPRFEWRDDQSYVLDRASSYTLSIEPA